MRRNHHPLGRALVYQGPSGLVVDTDSIRRDGAAFDGFGDVDEEEDFEVDFDGVGDEEDEEDFEVDFDGVGDDDDYYYDDSQDGVGFSFKKLARMAVDPRYAAKVSMRAVKKAHDPRTYIKMFRGKKRRSRRVVRPPNVARRALMTPRMGWGETAIGGSTTLGAAGTATVQIRLQHDFRARDVTFDGSLAGTLITSITFGDRNVWSSAAGLPIVAFASTGFIRGLLKGQYIKAGLDISVVGTLTGAGTLQATLTGLKPNMTTC